MNKFFEGLSAFSIIAAIGFVLAPLSVFSGWITGVIIKLICGQFIADGLNVLFGTARFSPDVIPLIGGCLGFISLFFKSSTSSSEK